jgi:hypothetical protein
MAVYRIHRLKDQQRQHFRWAPHSCGAASIKPKDYVEAGAIEAATPYAAWFQLRQSSQPLEVGDLLESADGELRIYKYVGFEEARWLLPEVKTGLESAPAAVGQPETGYHTS